MNLMNDASDIKDMSNEDVKSIYCKNKYCITFALEYYKRNNKDGNNIIEISVTDENCKEKVYKVLVCIQENEILEIAKGRANYQQEFKDAAILITDYSSVFFDFVYKFYTPIYL